MARKPGKNLYLYLALVCFLGIVLIFFFDGYVGVYDSLKADNGTYVQEISAEQWQNPERYGPTYSLGLDQNGYLAFTYRLENRRFGSLSDAVRVTVYDPTAGNVTEILINTLKIGMFGQGMVSWTLNGSDFVPEGTGVGVLPNLRMVIERGTVTREIAIYLNRNADAPKAIPAPVE